MWGLAFKTPLLLPSNTAQNPPVSSVIQSLNNKQFWCKKKSAVAYGEHSCPQREVSIETLQEKTGPKQRRNPARKTPNPEAPCLDYNCLTRPISPEANGSSLLGSLHSSACRFLWGPRVPDILNILASPLQLIFHLHNFHSIASHGLLARNMRGSTSPRLISFPSGTVSQAFMTLSHIFMPV